MIKSRIISIKSSENEKIIVSIIMTKIIIKTGIIRIIMIIMMIIRIKTSHRIKIELKAIHVSLKGKNLQQAIFYWDAKVT